MRELILLRLVSLFVGGHTMPREREHDTNSDKSSLAEETELLHRQSRVLRHHAEDLAEQLAELQKEVQRTLDEIHSESSRQS